MSQLYHHHHTAYSSSSANSSFRRSTNNELKQMNDLNNRFVNFIQLVKSETVRSEILQKSLVDEKERRFASLRLANATYVDNLAAVKKYLNELCLDVCHDLVREKHNKILIDWFSKLVSFEQSFSGGGIQINATTTNNRCCNTGNGIISYFDTSSPCSNSCFGEFCQFPSALSEVEHSSQISTTMSSLSSSTTLPIMMNLCNLSGISSSQSSLNSCSSSNFSISPSTTSSSSSSSSSAYGDTSLSGGVGVGSSAADQFFSLEVYLSSLSKTKAILSDDYEKKVAECAHLKENIGNWISNFINKLNF